MEDIFYKWIVEAVAGLILIGFGLSLFGQSVIYKSGGASLKEMVSVGNFEPRRGERRHLYFRRCGENARRLRNETGAKINWKKLPVKSKLSAAKLANTQKYKSFFSILCFLRRLFIASKIFRPILA